MTDTLSVGGGNTDFAAKVALAAEGGSAFVGRINLLRQVEEAAAKAKQDLGIAGDAAVVFEQANAKLAEAKERVAKAKAEAEAVLVKAKSAADDTSEKANATLAEAEKTLKAATAEAKAVRSEADKALKAAQAEALEMVRSAKAQVGDIQQASAGAQAALSSALDRKAKAEASAAVLEGAARDFLTAIRGATDAG